LFVSDIDIEFAKVNVTTRRFLCGHKRHSRNRFDRTVSERPYAENNSEAISGWEIA